MIERLVVFALKNRLVVLLAAAVVVGLGYRAIREIPIDAFPDVTNIQVQVIAMYPGRSPVEVEQSVTFPIEVAMSGLPGLTELRSLSKFGLSVVTVVFEDRVDIYFARQVVLERVIEAKEGLPEGVEVSLGPVTTGMGEIYQYTIERPGGGDTEAELIEMRTIQDWIVRPLLKTVPGVADVSSFGGYVKEIQVSVHPDALFKHGLALREVFDAVAANNTNAGGGILTRGAEQHIVRGLGLVESLADVERIVVAEHDGVPIVVGDVAAVAEGPAVRQGAAVKDGTREVAGGIVMMTRGESGRDVAARVHAKVIEINTSSVLPGGAQIVAFYDRTDLVTAAVNTVTSALLEGALLVVAVLLLFLGNVRSALIVTATLPLSILGAFIIMRLPAINLSANLMTLGGLAIAIGIMVDGSVVMVENIFRHFAERRHERLSHVALALDAAREVGRPIVFGILIIIIVFLPLFTLEGMEGKLFAPLAITISLALLGSMLCALVLSPVLCSLLLRPRGEGDTAFIRGLKRHYRRLLLWALGHRPWVLGGAVSLVLGSLAIVPFLGTEFIPILDEGSLTPQVIRIPSISLDESVAIEKRVQQTLMQFPEVTTVVSKIGTAEIATDPMGPNVSDPFVILKPRAEWVTARNKAALVDRIREALEEIPGVAFNITQPIALRVDELISGVKSQIAVKLFGDDLEVLEARADEIADVLATVRGVADLRVEQVAGQPYLTIEVDRGAIARYGINVADVQDLIEVAIAGTAATQFFDGARRFDIVVRFPEIYRNDLDAIGDILVPSANGSRVPLAQIARLSLVEGPVQISREDIKRRIVIESNVRGRDIGSFVAEAQEKIKERVTLPPGYYITWGGAFENQQRAMARLMVIVPLTIGLIFFLLFASFGSLRQAALIILNLPFAMVGGVFSLFAFGLFLSVPAAVGFIALFGVAVLNGIVLVSYINSLRQEGVPLHDAIVRGAELRLRPVLMTALVAALGLVPLLLAHGPGAEVQRPLAAVVVGGLLTSTALTLIVLPVLFGWFEEPRREADA